MCEPEHWLRYSAELYCRALSAKDPKALWVAQKAATCQWREGLLAACTLPMDEGVVEALSPVARQAAQLLFLDFLCVDSEARPEKLQELIDLVRGLLEDRHESTSQLAVALLESFIVGLDILPAELARRMINELGALTGVDTGTDLEQGGRAHRRDLTPRSRGTMRSLMNAALYTEVIGFCQARREVKSQEMLAGVAASVSCPLVSVFSRKGGVGKTMFLMSVASWALREVPGIRICVVDLDLSGPSWQYILFRDQDGPEAYLNDILPMDQSPDLFEFDGPTCEMLAKAVTRGALPWLPRTHIWHLGVRDLPRSNRLLWRAADRRKQAFFPYLARLLVGLAANHDLLLVDNSPGFDSVAFASLGIASMVPSGLPVVLSTPYIPDLGGTFLELADIRLLGLSRPPVWVVNKTTPDAEAFLRSAKSVSDVAERLLPYRGVLPDVPLVKKLIPPDAKREVGKTWRFLPYDNRLVDLLYVQRERGPVLVEATESAAGGFSDAVDTIMGDLLRPMLGPEKGK